MRAHPDRGGSAERFIQINRAYEEAYADAMNLNCSECSGTGTVSKSRGWAVIKMTCPDCGGTGKPWAELKE